MSRYSSCAAHSTRVKRIQMSHAVNASWTSGELVAVPIATLLQQHAEDRRELAELVADAKEREDAFRAFLLGKGLH